MLTMAGIAGRHYLRRVCGRGERKKIRGKNGEEEGCATNFEKKKARSQSQSQGQAKAEREGSGEAVLVLLGVPVLCYNHVITPDRTSSIPRISENRWLICWNSYVHSLKPDFPLWIQAQATSCLPFSALSPPFSSHQTTFAPSRATIQLTESRLSNQQQAVR
jgi:hypothetical protein